MVLCGSGYASPDQDQWVQADHILVEKAEAARLVKDWVVNGSSFELLARRWSSDPGSGMQGGQLSVARCSEYVPEFAAAVCKSPLNEVGLVQTQFGWHVYRVKSRAASREDVLPVVALSFPKANYNLILSCHFQASPEKSVGLSIDGDQLLALIGQQPALLQVTETHYTLLSNGLSRWTVDRTTGLGQVSSFDQTASLAIGCRKATARLF